MKILPCENSAYKLLHNGSVALAQVEANGMRVDTDYLETAIKKTNRRINRIAVELQQDKIYKTWRKHFGSKTNMGSREQLGVILFDEMGHKCLTRNKNDKPKSDEEALSSTGLPFVKKYLKMEQLKKAQSTYLKGILRHVTDGFVHPNFPLHLVQSYRGSSDAPNFQNIPIRDPAISKLIRRAFIPRPDHQIVEVDYGGVEICCATCYHKDPRMIRYINNPKLDLHRDMAGQCYVLEKNEITKDARYCGKNQFVFPQFYGDWYLNCAQGLWKIIDTMNLTNPETGHDLYSHLETQGIYELGDCDPNEKPKKGTFEKHIQEVEYDFWNNRFKVYGQWKKDWWQAYQDSGYFDTLTGFRVAGVLDRKQAINYPVQGSAFHWLLWSLIKIQRLLRKYKMRSLIVGQIHDSIVSDVHKDETEDYLEIAKQVMTIDVKKHWPWINVPLTIEAEVAPVGGTWYDKKKVKI